MRRCLFLNASPYLGPHHRNKPWATAAKEQWKKERCAATATELAMACTAINSLLADRSNNSKLQKATREKNFQLLAMTLSKEHIASASLSQILTMVKACVHFRSHSAEVLRQCLPRLQAHTPTMSSAQCLSLLRQLPKELCGEPLHDSLRHRVLTEVESFPPRDMAFVYHELSMMGASSRSSSSSLATVEAHLLRMAPELAARDLSLALRALCSTLRSRPDKPSPLLRILMEECTLRAHDLSLRDIADILSALSSVHCVDWTLYTSLGEEAGRRAHEATMEDAGRILGAFQGTSIQCEELARVMSGSSLMRQGKRSF